jgi:hypothetical protein
MRFSRNNRRPSFVPYRELGDQPNIIVDGAPNSATVLTLSHWPATPTPPELARDLSVEIVLAYRANQHLYPFAPAASNDHLDQDGLAALIALTRGDMGSRLAKTLIQIAAAGDFAWPVGEVPRQFSFALAALADPSRSPWPEAAISDYHQRQGAMYQRLIEELPRRLCDPRDWLDLWREEEDFFSRSMAAFAKGAARLDYHREVDLAVVRLDSALAGLASRFVHPVARPIHPMAIHQYTPANRILVSAEARHLFYYRYESWIRLASRPVPRRRDLSLAAQELTEAEAGGPGWRFSGVTALEATLGPTNGQRDPLAWWDHPESGLTAEFVQSTLIRHLAELPPAFDPFGTGAEHRPAH